MSPALRLGDAPLRAVVAAMEDDGLVLDLGAASLRLRSDVPALARALQAVAPEQAFPAEPGWVDFHVGVQQAPGLRRLLRPQVRFVCDAGQPFDPFPASHALPILEWGSNWLIGQHLHHLLLLHAGAVERDGCALLMPATPGSGKSTLTAALALRGWRLLSDEFGAWDPAQAAFVPMLKPVALKNASIDVIRSFDAAARLGPSYPGTRKGTVAHLAPPGDAFARRREPAAPGAFVFPHWLAGSATTFEPMEPDEVFGALAFNAFNYKLLGDVGFEAVVTLVRRCPAWRLQYSDLDDAVATLARHWPPRGGAA
jgi:HprK-related kinase A